MFREFVEGELFVLTTAGLSGQNKVWFRNFHKVSLLFSYSTGISFEYVTRAFKAKPVADIYESTALKKSTLYSNRLGCWATFYFGLVTRLDM